MKIGAGKVKGGRFERWTGHRFSLWLTGGADATQLIRSVLSGGWSAAAGTYQQVGDLAPNGPIGDRFRRAFGVECKHRAEIDLWELWSHERGGLLGEWWTKLDGEVRACGASRLQPMLVFRANRMPTMVAVRETLLERRVALADGVTWLLPPSIVTRVARLGWLDVAVFPLDDLLRCPPDGFLAGKDEAGYLDIHRETS